MFVYGTAGRKAPYAIKVLTELRLAELLVSKTNYKSIIIKNASFFLFMDATHE
tara:strand:+ start:1563 stop:1721 length:159 start_codon:yes stop_codon:yes gene_type:complete